MLKIFAVLDKRTGTYRPPMFFKHVAECTRWLEGIANNPESDLNKWPLDFQLDELGDFDETAGQFANFTRNPICQIQDLIKAKESPTINQHGRPIIDPVQSMRQ